MASENTITLGPREQSKLGISHCGVTCEGLISVVGEQRNIADGEAFTFDKVGITASRAAEVYTFVKN